MGRNSRRRPAASRVLSLAAGSVPLLGEHDPIGEATLQVLAGRIRLTAGASSRDGGPGDHLVIPPERHDLLVVTDAVVLRAVATRA